jgi:hypothetical protein
VAVVIEVIAYLVTLFVGVPVIVTLIARDAGSR